METPPNKRPHILLGITGSIAAVKGPRLALFLSQNVRTHVKVVLTRTVEQYFWKEGGVTESYDEVAWKEFWRVVDSSRGVTMEEDVDVNVDWRNSHGGIAVHCKFLLYEMKMTFLLEPVSHHTSILQ
jgi:hypothetical protein